MKAPKPQRRKRPEPDRTEPDRSWAASAPRATKQNGAKPSAARAKPNGATPSGAKRAPKDDDTGAGAGAEPKTSDRANPRSSTYRALNDAYRLVDEYLRQGQKMAENIWLPQSGSGAPSFPAFGAPDRFMRAVGDMTLAWVEVMQQWTSAQGAPSRAPTGSAGPFTAGVTPEPRAATPAAGVAASPLHERELTVSVEAKGRVTVSVQLAERIDLAELEVTALRPAKGRADAIGEVSLNVDGTSAVLRVVVPERQPRGTYNGLLVETKTQKPRGTLSLVVA
jgi:hypothetical protein